MRERGLVGWPRAAGESGGRRPTTLARDHRRRGSLLAAAWAVWLTGCLLAFCQSALGQAPLPIYTDHLVNGFQDWSWAAHNLANTGSFVHSGSDSISVSATAWQAVWLEHDDFSTSLYSNLSFWINGGPQGGQVVHVAGVIGGASQGDYPLPKLAANTWVNYTVALSALGVEGLTNCNGFWFQVTDSGTTNTFYVDDLQLGPQPAPALTHISVDAANVLRTADARWFGVNTAVWDGDFATPETISELTEAGVQFMRFPGGSLSDDYHWASNTTDAYTWQWATSFDDFAQVAANIGASAIITANYGSGTPAEAAGWVRYANLTNGYGFKYWEIGNEVYGASWETDSNNLPHDAYTYAARAQSYIQQMKAADPTIKIGVVVITGEDNFANYTNHPATNAVTGQVHYGWTPVLMATLKQLGVTPDFAIYHWYPEYTDSESDPFLLQGTGNWIGAAANLRQMITDYYGAGGGNIELLVTENNSNAGTQGKQSVSLVNGLYYADSLGQLMKTEFNSFVWWDLRNGLDTGGNLDPVLYGWRMYGDLGLIDGIGTVLSNRYPTFFTAKLAQYFVRPGDSVLDATSDYPLLSAYAARRTNGSLTLLVINKDPAAAFPANIALANFLPGSQSVLYSYGMPQDNAAETGVGSCDLATAPLPGAASSFNYTFAPYSATVLALAPTAPCLAALPLAPDAAQIIIQLQGQPGVPFILQSSTDLTVWTSVSTNTTPSGPLFFTNTIVPGSPRQFWRAVWQP